MQSVGQTMWDEIHNNSNISHLARDRSSFARDILVKSMYPFIEKHLSMDIGKLQDRYARLPFRNGQVQNSIPTGDLMHDMSSVLTRIVTKLNSNIYDNKWSLNMISYILVELLERHLVNALADVYRNHLSVKPSIRFFHIQIELHDRSLFLFSVSTFFRSSTEYDRTISDEAKKRNIEQYPAHFEEESNWLIDVQIASSQWTGKGRFQKQLNDIIGWRRSGWTAGDWCAILCRTVACFCDHLVDQRVYRCKFEVFHINVEIFRWYSQLTEVWCA